jgi:hypothetical protein
MMSIALQASLLLSLASSGQQPAARPAHSEWPERVLFDARDSSIYARGRNWKAAFSDAGLTFIPFLGSDAPRNEPVEFVIEDVRVGGDLLATTAPSVPIRSEDTIRYVQGSIEVVYDASLAGIEQTLVLHDLPARDAIHVRCAVHSELEARAIDQGIEFSCAHGGVRYTTAIARDAAGRTRALEARWIGGAIELCVPADFVRGAVLPLAIDPLIEAYNSTPDSIDEIAPDTAVSINYAHFRTRWDVWEIVWSQSDHDVALRAVVLGSWQSTSYLIDATPEYWSGPKVGGCEVINVFGKTSGGCAVAAVVGDPASGAREIRGRALTQSLQPPVLISGADAGDKHALAFAGETYYGDTPTYCAVWEIDRPGGEKDIQERALYDNGQVFSAVHDLAADPNVEETRPAISKSDGEIDWCIVWERRVSPSNRDIWARRVDFGGAFVTPAFSVSEAPEDETRPNVSSRSEDAPVFIVACEQERGGKHDVFLHVIDGTSALSHTNLTMLEVGSSAGIDRSVPAIDGIQNDYLVAYKESYVGQDLHRAWCTRFAIDHAGNPTLIETRVPFGGLASPELAPVATDEGHFNNGPAAPPGFELVWDEPMPPSGSHDVFGAHFQPLPSASSVTTSCFGDGSDTACPCANNPGAHSGCPNATQPLGAELAWTGQAKLADPTLTVHAQRLPPQVTAILVQGDLAQHPALVFGAGLLCIGGNRTDIATRTTSAQGTFDYPAQHGDLPISTLGFVPSGGGTRFYQVFYRDPIGSCADTGNSTNALAVFWSD